MFCDETKILVTAGRGGDGSVSFRREKFVPKGGPDGGDGGQGGSLVLKANENINTLSDINSHKHYKAENGGAGHKKKMSGKAGENLILQVPVGTVVWNVDKSKIITDLNSHSQEFIIAKGGKGGLGNQHFASSVNQAPTFAEMGEPGEEKEILLELKLVADIGLVGYPSVGKSTLIAHVSNARPKIAEYEFTTLVPNLGVVDMRRFGGENFDAFVIADIPGIIEGASHGKGLGLKFLRHIARNSVLIHIVDPLRPNPVENFKTIQHELELFNKSLLKKPLIVAINKIDAVQPKEVEKITKELFENIKPKPKKIFPISSVTGKGLKELLFEALKEIRNVRQGSRQSSSEEIESQETIVLTPHKELVKFKIEQIKKKKTHRIFVISGRRIEQVLKMTDLNNSQGLERVYHFLNKMGILKAVKREKAEINDIIEIAGKPIPYRD